MKLDLTNMPLSSINAAQVPALNNTLLEPPLPVRRQRKGKGDHDPLGRAKGIVDTERLWGDMDKRGHILPELEAELDKETITPEIASLVKVMIKIEKGELPRPINMRIPKELFCVSWSNIALLAGIKRSRIYELGELKVFMTKYAHRLTGPCYEIKVHSGGWRETQPGDAMAAIALEKMERAGVKIPRITENANNVSLLKFAEMNSIPYTVLNESTSAGRRLRNAAARPGALGDAVPDQWSRQQSDDQLNKELAVIESYEDEGLPLPASPIDPNLPDLEDIHDQANPDGPYVIHRVEHVSAIQAHVAKYGVARTRLFEPTPMTEERFKAAMRERFEQAGGGSGSANFASSVNRVARALTVKEHGTIDLDEFDDVEAVTKKAAALEPTLQLRAQRNLMSHVGTMALFAADLGVHEDGYPVSASEALDFAMRRENKFIKDVVEISGIGKPLFDQIILAQTVRIHEKELDGLRKLDDALAMGGALIRRLTFVKRKIKRCGSDYFRSLSCELTRFLPDDAYLMPDAELKERVGELDKRVMRNDRVYTKVMALAREIWSEIPDLPKGCRVDHELRRLGIHKHRRIPSDGLDRRGNAHWSKATMDLNIRMLRCCMRWCALAVESGGMGIPIEDLSLALFLDERVLLAYLNWRAGLFANIEVNASGTPRGPVLTIADTDIFRIVGALLDEEYGWITQQPKYFRPLMVERRIEWPDYSNIDDLQARYAEVAEEEPEDMELLGGTDTMGLPLFNAGILEACDVDFTKHCKSVRSRLMNRRADLRKLVVSSRAPFDLVSHILKTPDPMSFLTDILRRMSEDIPNQQLHPFEHAKHCRNYLVFAFLVLTTLRSKNLRGLTFGEEDSEVRIEDGLVTIVIPFQKFKNLGSFKLFGPEGNRMDYERELDPNFYGVEKMLTHYVKTCRPVIIANYAVNLRRRAERAGLDPDTALKTTNRLFPVRDFGLMDSSSMFRIVKDITRRYHVLDETTGRPRPGFNAFGPHAVRDIVASHIIKTSDDPNKFEKVADLLQTSVEMVRTRYAFQDVKDRTGSLDYIFREQQKGFNGGGESTRGS